MNLHRPSRSCRPLFLVVIATLLLTASQLTGGAAAQVPPEQPGLDFLAILQGDSALRAIPGLATPDTLLHTPEGMFQGRDGFDQFAALLQGSFTNLDFATQKTEVVEHLVIVEFRMSGIHTGSYRDMPSNCAGINVPGVVVLRIHESGITEQWIGYDRDALVAQIDGFHQLDPTNRPDCSNLTADQPAPDANCVRRDRCDATS